MYVCSTSITIFFLKQMAISFKLFFNYMLILNGNLFEWEQDESGNQMFNLIIQITLVLWI